MDIIFLEFNENLPNVNDSELSHIFGTDFNGEFEWNGINHMITGNVSFDITEEEINGTEYAPDTIDVSLDRFYYMNVEVQEMEEETYIKLSAEDMQTLQNEIENYINNKFYE